MTSILVDAREFDAGRRTGIGRYLEGFLQALGQAHPDWRLSVAMGRPGALPESLSSRVEVIGLPVFAEWAWPGLARGHDLFFSPYPKLPWRDISCPLVHTVHDVLYLTQVAYRDGGGRSALSRFRLQHALHKASLTWFVSQASMQECESLFGTAGRCPVVRLNAIDASFIPAEAEPDAAGAYFLYVGNGLPHKNLDVLMQVMPGIDTRLICVGVRDERVAWYRGTFQGVGDKVEFKGQIDDRALLDMYRGAAALLFPSTAEGFGYPPLEAMACGTPAIVADIPVLRETTGGAAILCDAHDAAAWRNAMRRMLLPDERMIWAQKGLDWARPLQGAGGWKRHIADLEQLLGVR